ncbi:CIA30 family protein [Mangrovivirga sp. M17]|uniref:CIA30 family protein n=1 Tax=Mangrovivirga halotolerans TaxID=2993936 RepID=A0ABT3RPK1_9BACT|nr:CIA30 family protein [Mangrovivirga halotolerans]MCX2743095.1 CIA30 family protein [Mangrovivirga halotolerans]
MTTTIEIFDFKKNSDISEWKIVNDDVMGGVSNSQFYLSNSGHGVFKGHVSLENNGGFCSVRHRFDINKINNYSSIVIKVKGEGKRYQLRIKKSQNDSHSYIHYFDTSGNWEIIEIPLNQLIPWYRGNKLNIPDFQGNQIQEIGFLIGNKKEEDFKLLIDNIYIKSEK